MAVAPEPDVVLTFGSDSSESPLKTHSYLLKLASPVLRDALAQQQEHYTLPVIGDSVKGWKHLLQLLDPSKPELSNKSLSLANAQAALPIAAKYCMQRPIQRYTQHIRHIKVGTLKEAVQWLDLFCHTCKASDPIIAHFAGACSSMVKMGTGLSDAAALITGARSVGVQAPPAGAAIDLHPLAASHILAAAFNAMPHIQRHVFHCSTCSAEQVYWEQKKIQSFGSCAPITLDCNACKGTMHKPCL